MSNVFDFITKYYLEWILCGIVLYLIFRKLVANKSVKISGKHIFITGGSKGIGKEVVRSLIHKGASRITILARKLNDLKKTQSELQNESCSIHIISGDTTDYKQLKINVKDAINKHGDIDILICCAGMAIPGYFIDQTPDIFQRQMNVNYMGTVNTIQAILPYMIDKRSGNIVIVSSSICGGTFIGYSSYAPTKFALRALADSLRNELLGFNIGVHISFPADTDTPGFELEQKTKPIETKTITPPQLYSAQKVAKDLVKRLSNGDYHLLSCNLEANLSLMMTAGIAPRNNTLIDIIIAPILFLVQQAWRIFNADRIAKQYGKNFKKEK